MPQTFHIIKCFECEIFQVHIVKKSNKWECKMCGKKQSLKKVFFEGNAKECRLHVQDLNAMRGNKECLAVQNESEKLPEQCHISTLTDPQQSKWSKYMDDDVDLPDDNISDVDGDIKYVLETLPTNKRRKLNSCNVSWRGRKSFKSNKNDRENLQKQNAYLFSPKNVSVKENKLMEPTCDSNDYLRLQNDEYNIRVNKDTLSKQSKNPEDFFSNKTDKKNFDSVKTKFTSCENEKFGHVTSPYSHTPSNVPVVNICQPGNSKWDKFLDKTDNISDEDSKYSDFSSGANYLEQLNDSQNSATNLTSCHKNIFSSIDDSNLDEILEI